MRLAACGKEIYVQLFKVISGEIVVTVSRQFEEAIVSALQRQLNQTAFSSSVHKASSSKIVQRLAAQFTEMPLAILQTLSAKTLRLLLHHEILRRQTHE